jgi:hypothetical protein
MAGWTGYHRRLAADTSYTVSLPRSSTMSATSVETIADIVVPDTALVRDITAFNRETEG